MNALITNLSTRLSLEEQLVSLLLLVLTGLVLHLLLGVLLKRLHLVARRSSQNWDDVITTAVEVPIRFVLWVAVFYLALDIYPVAAGVQQTLLQVYDTALVFLLAWFLHRLISGVEGELLNEALTHRFS